MRLIGLAIVLALGVPLAPLAGDAQQATKLAKIGLLSVTTPAVVAPNIEAFRRALRELAMSKGRRSCWRFATERAESNVFRSSYMSWWASRWA
jgi:hypothetical protein